MCSTLEYVRSYLRTRSKKVGKSVSTLADRALTKLNTANKANKAKQEKRDNIIKEEFQ